jgi:hypothetical protein
MGSGVTQLFPSTHCWQSWVQVYPGKSPCSPKATFVFLPSFHYSYINMKGFRKKCQIMKHRVTLFPAPTAQSLEPLASLFLYIATEKLAGPPGDLSWLYCCCFGAEKTLKNWDLADQEWVSFKNRWRASWRMLGKTIGKKYKTKFDSVNKLIAESNCPCQHILLETPCLSRHHSSPCLANQSSKSAG